MNISFFYNVNKNYHDDDNTMATVKTMFKNDVNGTMKDEKSPVNLFDEGRSDSRGHNANTTKRSYSIKI